MLGAWSAFILTAASDGPKSGLNNREADPAKTCLHGAFSRGGSAQDPETPLGPLASRPAGPTHAHRVSEMAARIHIARSTPAPDRREHPITSTYQRERQSARLRCLRARRQWTARGRPRGGTRAPTVHHFSGLLAEMALVRPGAHRSARARTGRRVRGCCCCAPACVRETGQAGLRGCAPCARVCVSPRRAGGVRG